MNKYINEILYFVCITFIVSCTKEDGQINVSDFPHFGIYATENLSHQLSVTGGNGKYTCSVDDENILQAEVIGEILTVHCLSPGTAVVTVIDGKNKPGRLTVNIGKQKISYEITDSSIEIEMDNAEIKELITEEIETEYSFPIGTLYEMFVKSENPYSLYRSLWGDLSIYMPQNENVITGSFSMESPGRENYIIMISYSQNKRLYYSNMESGELVFIEDFTEKYQNKYPEAKIEKIGIIQTVKQNP